MSKRICMAFMGIMVVLAVFFPQKMMSMSGQKRVFILFHGKFYMNVQQEQLEEKDLFEQIAARKKELKGQVLILAHHYQNENVFQFADLTGDSLKLAREAAEAGKPSW